MKILKRFGELNWNKSIDLQQPNRNKPKPNRKHQIQRRKYHDREQELIYWLQWIILFNGLTWFAASQFLQLVHFSSSIFISVNVMHRALNFMLTLSQSRKHGTHKKTRLWSSSVSTYWFFLFRVKFQKWNSVQKARNTLQLNRHK